MASNYSTDRINDDRYRVGNVYIQRRGAWWSYDFHVRNLDEHGQRIGSARLRGPLNTQDLGEAMQLARDINEQRERRAYERPDAQPIFFADLVKEFRQTYTGWAPTTMQGTKALSGKLCDEFGNCLIGHMTARMIEEYLSRRQKANKRKMSISTANRYRAYVKRLFNWAVDMGYLTSTPMAALRMVKEEQKLPEPLTDEEVEKLIAHSSGRLQALVIVAVDTGLRRSELFRLKWSDVDFKDKSLRILQTKTKKPRVIPMTNRVQETLTSIKHEDRKKKLTARVFPFTDVKKGLHGASERAGIGHVHPHRFRHTFATRLRDRGVPLDRIKDLLGHKTMQMVLRYAQARPEQSREAIETLNGK